MPTATSNRAVIPLSALHEILRWAENRSVWQRDALRRIIVSGGIDEAGLEDLERLCRHDHKADSSKAALPTAEPLAAKHLPPGPGTQASVALTSIGKLDGVNKLPSDQVLTFGSSPGLTVIFGNNGSGKSGYARVIKRACRSRGAPPVIRPNVYASTPAKPAS